MYLVIIIIIIDLLFYWQELTNPCLQKVQYNLVPVKLNVSLHRDIINQLNYFLVFQTTQAKLKQ